MSSDLSSQPINNTKDTPSDLPESEKVALNENDSKSLFSPKNPQLFPDFKNSSLFAPSNSSSLFSTSSTSKSLFSVEIPSSSLFPQTSQPKNLFRAVESTDFSGSGDSSNQIKPNSTNSIFNSNVSTGNSLVFPSSKSNIESAPIQGFGLSVNNAPNNSNYFTGTSFNQSGPYDSSPAISNFGNPSNSSLFGSNTTNNSGFSSNSGSLFGQNSGFASNTNSTNGFSFNNNPTTGFSFSSNMFGSSSTPSFNNFNTSDPVISSAPNNSSLFGSTAVSNNQGGFSNSNTSNPISSAPNNSSLFGSTAGSNHPVSFNNSAGNNPTPVNNSTGNNSGLFSTINNKNSSTNLFANNSAPTNSLFGSTNHANNPQPASNTSIFASTNNHNSGFSSTQPNFSPNYGNPSSSGFSFNSNPFPPSHAPQGSLFNNRFTDFIQPLPVFEEISDQGNKFPLNITLTDRFSKPTIELLINQMDVYLLSGDVIKKYCKFFREKVENDREFAIFKISLEIPFSSAVFELLL